MADNVLEFTDANFATEVLAHDQLTLVDFWATWCQPCLRLAPTIEALATEYAGKVRVGKVNSDQNPQVSMEHRVSALPTLMFFKGGKVVGKLVGAVPKDKIVEAINNFSAA